MVEEKNELRRRLWEESLLWRGRSSLPSGVVRPHVVASGNFVYVGGGNSGRLNMTRTVFKFDSQKNVWSSLPIAPCYNFSMALVESCVTLIGGISVLTSIASNALLSYDQSGGKWSHSRLPPLPTKRSCSSAIAVGGYLVVVGGTGDTGPGYLDTVEVLDIRAKKWYTAASFPKPVTFMCIAASSDKVYLTGGLTNSGAVKEVISCSLKDLLSSCEGLRSVPKEKAEQRVWDKIDVPCCRSGCCVVNEKLVVFGGMLETQSSDKISSSVYVLDHSGSDRLTSSNTSWRLAGDMCTKRSSMSLAVIGPTNVLMVGGYVDPRNWMNSLTKDVVEVVNLLI